MKGILKKIEADWFVWHWDDLTQGYESLPLYQETFDIDKKQPIIPLVEGDGYEFDVVEVYHELAQVGYRYVNYAKLINAEYPEPEETLPPCNDVTWDNIFDDIELTLGVYTATRVINYMKNKYNAPIKK